jgi:hypothetical protein
MTKSIINVTTGEIVERELNAEELKRQAIDEKEIMAKKALIKSQAEAMETAKAALLDKLGITAEEAALLLS